MLTLCPQFLVYVYFMLCLLRLEGLLCDAECDLVAIAKFLDCIAWQSMCRFCRSRPCISATYAVMWCLSVRPSVTFVDCVKTSNHIVKIFSPSGSGSHTILVLPYQMSWQYSDGNPSNWGVECKWSTQKSRFWASIWFQCVLWTIPAASAVHTAATDHGELMTLVAGKRRSLLMAQDDDEVYDKKPQRYAEDSGKSEA